MASNVPRTGDSNDHFTIVGATGNARVHNLTIVGKKYVTGKVDVDEIQTQTVDKIDLWTQGTVEPSSLLEVLEKIRTGSAWVTITGSPGEGKSTLGYWVLKHLQQTRNVFKVRSPEQFDEIIKTSAPVIFLDDIFGQTVFDEAAWKEWKESIEEFMNINEHKPINESGTLILVARDFVLKSGSRNTEDPWEMLINNKHVVNISGAVRENEEKIKILNSISNKYNVHLNSDTIETICGIDTPHGFPHTCKLFITLHQDQTKTSAVEFFNTPLQFLNKSLKILIKDKVIEHIFMEMMKGDGRVVKIELSKCGSQYVTTANDLCTYIKPDGNGYVFDHPSILDAIAFLLCEAKLPFILEHCSMNFIKERVWLHTPDGKKRKGTEDGAILMTEITWNDAEELARRFVKEIEAGNWLDVKYHNAWKSDLFVNLLIQKCK